MSPVHEEWLADLTLAQLLTVLRLDSLNIEHEQTVCHVAVQWLERLPRRGPSAAEVFKCVRWTHFTDEDRGYLEELLANTVVKKYCLDLIEGARQIGMVTHCASLWCPSQRAVVAAVAVALLAALRPCWWWVVVEVVVAVAAAGVVNGVFLAEAAAPLCPWLIIHLRG